MGIDNDNIIYNMRDDDRISMDLEVPFMEDYFLQWMIERGYKVDTIVQYWRGLLEWDDLIVDIGWDLYAELNEAFDNNISSQKESACSRYEQLIEYIIENERPEPNDKVGKSRFKKLQTMRSAWRTYRTFLDWVFDSKQNIDVMNRNFDIPFQDKFLTFLRNRNVSDQTAKGYLSHLRSIQSAIFSQRDNTVYRSPLDISIPRLLLMDNERIDLMDELQIGLYDLSHFSKKDHIGKWISAYNNYIDFISELLDEYDRLQSIPEFCLEYVGEYDSLIETLNCKLSDKVTKSIISNFIEPIGIINIGQEDVIEMVSDAQDIEIGIHYGDTNNIQALKKDIANQTSKCNPTACVMMQIFFGIDPKISVIGEIVKSAMHSKTNTCIYGVVINGSYPPGFIKVALISINGQ